jgi:hypothetical protein
MSETWERFKLHPWHRTKRFKYGRVRRNGEGYVVVSPDARGDLQAIYHLIPGNPICWLLAEGKGFAEVCAEADRELAAPVTP